MKLASPMPAALTIRPLVLTWEPWKNMTPDWLTRMICPLASIRPAICDGLGPTTRFSAMALDEG